MKIISNNLFFEEVKTILAQEKLVKIPVVGNSMKPFLQHGDIVVLKRLEETDLSLGNIVLAQFNKAYVLHRIVYQRETKVFLAGDGNFQQVEAVSAADILAVAIQAFRGTRELKINTSIRIWLSKIWYKLRPVRLVYSKFF